jgi:Family of unknown function (DUF5670)
LQSISLYLAFSGWSADWHTNLLWRKEPNMLWTISVILVVLWLLGLVSGYTMGGVIHALLVIALVVVVVQVIQGRRRL